MWDSVCIRLLKSLGLDPRQFAGLLAEEPEYQGFNAAYNKLDGNCGRKGSRF